MKKYIPFLFALLWGACSTQKKDTNSGIAQKDTVDLQWEDAHSVPSLDTTPTIDLETAIYQQLGKMKLSEFVDSIVYVPLSKPSIQTGILVKYSKPYLTAYYGKVYNQKGKYLGQVGELGEEPGEEFSQGYITLYDENKDLFYTMGDKLIQFDKHFKFTGKEILLTSRSKKTGLPVRGLNHPAHLVRAGKYNLLVNFPDSAYWMDENLNIVHKQRLIPKGYQGPPGSGSMVGYTESTHRDTARFFNCFTDKLYAVTEDGLEARWKINLGDLKADNKYLLNEYQELYQKELPKISYAWRRYGPREARELIAKTKIAQAIDGRYWMTRAYESDRYVWVSYKKLYTFEAFRGSLYNKEHWAVYDKRTGVLKTAQELVNDIDYITDFSPTKEFVGINDGVLTTVFWPTTDADAYMKWAKKHNLPVGKEVEKLISDRHKYRYGVLVHAYLKK